MTAGRLVPGEMRLQSTPEYFTRGKAKLDQSSLRVRCKHNVSKCMVEAGFEPPRWLHADAGEPDTYLLPLMPVGMRHIDVGADQWWRAVEKAIDLTRERIGWPS